MQRGRNRVRDVNGDIGTITVPYKNTANWGVHVAVTGYISAMTHPHVAESTFMTPILKYTATGSGGSTPTVQDVAVLVFASIIPNGLKLPLYGPGSIFRPDGVTIDTSLTTVANLIATMLGYGSDEAGNPLTSYQYGRRVAG